MRRVLIAAAIATTACSIAVAQPAPDGKRAGLRGIRVDQLRRDLAYISSDDLEGRLSLQPGDDQAIAWIADAFAKAGLKRAAIGLDGRPSYIQPVALVEYRNDPKQGQLTLSSHGRNQTWHAPDLTGGFKNDVDLSAPVVFAGFGITAPELRYDDYAGLDARGKIVLIFEHEPQEADQRSRFNGTGLTRYATTRVKVLNAQRHGALAVLVAPEPNRKHLTNAERFANVTRGNSPRTPLASQAIADDEVTIPAVGVSDGVVAALMQGSGETPAEAQAAIDRAGTPHSLAVPGSNLSLHLRNVSRRTALTGNVAGLLTGSDPRLASETIIISAHHDHDGFEPCADPAQPPVSVPSDPKPCPRIWHGADDNGSGTVGVVALARAFAANPVRPKRSILFVVFAAEERGLLGSFYMAAHPLRPLAGTRAMINFDMIGRDEARSAQTEGLINIPVDTTNRLNLIGAIYSPDYARTVREANEGVGLLLDDRFDHETALNVLFRSDQFPFLLKDVPTMWWFTGFHPDYHHTTDTVDKIDFSKMARILRLAYGTAWRFGNAAAPPRFVAAGTASNQARERR